MPEAALGGVPGGSPRVKICGLMRRQDVLHAERAGADFLGVVLSAGFGRSVDPGRAQDLFDGVTAPRVAVFVDESADEAARGATRIEASVVQLHGGEDRTTLEELRRLGPWALWKVVRARSVDDVTDAVHLVGDLVDGILVEGWREGVVGGAGVRVTVEPAGVRAAVPSGLDFVLAGGLTPENVTEAVARFGPDVVDVSSGVERTVGTKEPDLVEAFVRAARASSRRLHVDPSSFPPPDSQR